MLKSNGLSTAREGDKLTSKSQGFKSESNKMSNPKSSKQFVLCIEHFFIA